jgi:hypothetical protein
MAARPQRLVIVRRGAIELFEDLTKRFAGDPETLVLWDRRVTDRRVAVERRATDRRSGDRRFPEGSSVLSERGYFVTKSAWTPRADRLV